MTLSITSNDKEDLSGVGQVPLKSSTRLLDKPWHSDAAVTDEWPAAPHPGGTRAAG